MRYRNKRCHAVEAKLFGAKTFGANADEWISFLSLLATETGDVVVPAGVGGGKRNARTLLLALVVMVGGGGRNRSIRWTLLRDGGGGRERQTDRQNHNNSNTIHCLFCSSTWRYPQNKRARLKQAVPVEDNQDNLVLINLAGNCTK